MQMVSAVKMRKAQKEALEGRAYRKMLDSILKRIIEHTSDIQSLDVSWLKSTDGTRELYVLISSNKGLCGSFHSNLQRYSLKNIDFKNADFITIGSKGADFAQAMGASVIADFSEDIPYIDNVSAMFATIEEMYASGTYKTISLVYNEFISSIKSTPTIEEFLPVRSIEQLDESGMQSDELLSADYLIEPSVEELLKPLLEDYLSERLRSAIYDSEASEHSARMLAMKSATDNAGELVESLTLLRNKLRQTAITNELLDMIAAAQSTS